MTSLRGRLLGGGRLPDDLRAELAAEGPLILEEGLAGSITYRNYRAPHRHASFEKSATTGAIVVTSQRLLVWAGRGKNIDVPLDHALRRAIMVTVYQPGRICFSYDAAQFSSERSGTVEVRLRTTQASTIAELLIASG